MPCLSLRASRVLLAALSGGLFLPAWFSTAAAFPTKPTSALNVAATIESVSGDWMCYGFGSLWVPNGDQIVRVDPVRHKEIVRIQASGNFCAPSPDGRNLWLADVYGGSVTRVDATSNNVTGVFPVAITSSSEGSFAVTSGGVWVVTSRGNTDSGTLTRVDPVTGQIVADIRVQNDSHGVAAAGGFVWVTSYSNNAVTQVDAVSNQVVKRVTVDAGPRFIAGTDTGVWVLSQGSGRVAHISPRSGQLLAEIDAAAPGGGGDIAAGEGGVWVATFGKPVTRIDPRTNTVVEQFVGDGFGDAIRAGGGYVWVSGSKIYQLKFAP